MDHSSSIADMTQELAGGVDSAEPAMLQEQVAQGNFTGLRQFLARTRQSHDWQDRYFVLDLVGPSILQGSLNPLCATEPKSVDLSLIRGVHLLDLVSKSRGTKTADRTTEQQMAQTAQYVKATIASLRQATQLDPADPTPYVFLMRSCQIFSDLHKHLHQSYGQAIQLAPDFVPAHFVMVNAQSKKWAGSHQQSLQVARAAMSHALPPSDAPACVFLAHLLVWQHVILFDKDHKRAQAYTSDREVVQELNDAFDRWTQPPYRPRRSSLPYLHHAAYWYYQAGDRTRLQQAFAQTNGQLWDKAWNFAGDARKAHTCAVEFASTGKKNTEKKSGLFGWLK